MAISISGGFDTDLPLTIDEGRIQEVVAAENQDDTLTFRWADLDNLSTCEILQDELPSRGNLSGFGGVVGGVLGYSLVFGILSGRGISLVWALPGGFLGAAIGGRIPALIKRKDKRTVVKLTFSDLVEAKLAVDSVELEILQRAAACAIHAASQVGPSIQTAPLTLEQKDKARLNHWLTPTVAAFLVGGLGFGSWKLGLIGPPQNSLPDDKGGLSSWILDHVLLGACAVCVLMGVWSAVTGERRRRRLRRLDKSA
jgi:hypothetical protein